MNTIIQLEDIQRRFQVGDQEVRALVDINLEVGRGEYLSIMGPSGSGKSTLLNLVGLLDRPDGGHYRLNGFDVTTFNDQQQATQRHETIGFVFQFFHLIPRLTALENIELPLTLAGMEVDERRQRTLDALTAVGLSDRAHHRPDQLSGGQRQRVAIARATIMRPPILLADEPTGNLDHTSGSEILALLEGLHELGITLAVVTHDPEIGQRAGRRILMRDGEIIRDESGTV